MKRVIKNNIFGFIVGAVIFTSIGVIAATAINARNIEYRDTNVESAIDDLYQSSDKYSSLTIPFIVRSYSTKTGGMVFRFADIIDKYAYFEVSTPTTNSYVSSCQLRASYQQSNIDLTPNTKYNTSDFPNGFWVNVISTTNDADATCTITLSLYN